MKIIATVVLAGIVLASGLVFVASSICAFGMMPNYSYALTGGLVACVSGAVAAGGVVLIARINRKEPE